MATTEELIITLTAERGKKFDETGEAIGSHERSIVFLPKGTMPGKQYRVILHAIREDSRGRMMYRGTSAPPEYFDRWKNNADGTLSHVTISRNWDLVEDEEGVRETRELRKRDGDPRISVKTEVVWGVTLAETIIRETITTTIPEIREVVVADGRLVEQEIATRDGGVVVKDHVVSDVEARSGSTWLQNTTRKEYGGDPKLSVLLHVKFVDGGVCKHAAADYMAWDDLPMPWIASHLSAPYPVCVCSRERVDTKAGKAVCRQCERTATQLVCVDTNLPTARRTKLSALARDLFSAQSFAGNDGESVVAAYREQWAEDAEMRALVAAEFAGYLWYYVNNDAVWGSKFSPEALELLSLLAQASGVGLERLSAWISGGQHRTADCEGRDFFYRTQVQGENIAVPDLRAESMSSASVAVKLVDLVGIQKVYKQREAEKQQSAKRPHSQQESPSGETVQILGRDLSSLFGGNVRVTRRR